MPTKEQIKWFWEQCGIQHMKHQGEDGWIRPDIDFAFSSPPDIDLNNLFKYAVPKIKRFHYIALWIVRDAVDEPQVIMWDANLATYEHFYSAREEDPALALFRAIYKALGGK